MAIPALRDVWGLGFGCSMWESMRTCFAVWAVPSGPPWMIRSFCPMAAPSVMAHLGPAGWQRRTKPEYWHVTKTYSPVHIIETEIPVPAAGQPLQLTVENRSDFANLNEFTFVYNILNSIGSIKATDAAPGQKGSLSIPSLNAARGQTLTVYVKSPRGFMVDAYNFALPSAVPSPAQCRRCPHRRHWNCNKNAQAITITGHGFRYTLDAATGQLREGRVGDHNIALEGPCLTLVPLDGEGGGTQLTGKEPTFEPLWGLCTNWKASSVMVENQSPDQSRDRKGAVVVKVTGTYSQAEGQYDLTFDATGRLNVAWKFKLHNAINPRQTGITFTLDKLRHADLASPQPVMQLHPETTSAVCPVPPKPSWIIPSAALPARTTTHGLVPRPKRLRPQRLPLHQIQHLPSFTDRRRRHRPRGPSPPPTVMPTPGSVAPRPPPHRRLRQRWRGGLLPNDACHPQPPHRQRRNRQQHGSGGIDG